jgi:hypothetical protein
MKNIKVKIKNKGEDGEWGNEESSMMARRKADSNCPKPKVQSPKFAGQSRPDSGGDWAEFEDLRSKTSFFSKRNDSAPKT